MAPDRVTRWDVLGVGALVALVLIGLVASSKVEVRTGPVNVNLCVGIDAKLEEEPHGDDVR